MRERTLSRRHVLEIFGGLAGASLVPAMAPAQQLPLKTAGLEHVGLTVPDPEATARFYGLIFDTQLFRSSAPPPRFFVRTGISYISLEGPAAGAQRGPAWIDHFCALVRDYNPQEMKKTLEDAGVRTTGGVRPGVAAGNSGGMAVDPDGLRLQLVGVPGGFVNTLLGYPRISQDYPAVQAIGIDHVMLAVSNLDQSAAHYARFFGKEIGRAQGPERIWFGVAKTRLGLQLAAAGTKPAVDHVCFKVAGFERRLVIEKFKRLGIKILPNTGEDALRFQDPNGLVMELSSNQSSPIRD